MTTEVELRTVASFEWASVAQYMVYLSSAAELCEIPSGNVYSFPYGRYGPEALIGRKTKTLADLEANKQRLERFVGRHEGNIGETELVVIRSLYRQYKAMASIVEDHLGLARRLESKEQLGLFGEGEGEGDEIPF